MTAPITGRTPIYGIEYPVVGEPIRTTRSKLERNAYQVESALQGAGAVPPSGPAWAAVAADSGWLAWPAPKPANWTWVAGGGVLAKYRVLGRQVFLSAEISSSAAWAAGVVLTTLPAGARPAAAWWFQGVGYGGVPMPCYVGADGGVRLANASSAAGGGWLTTSFPIS